MNDDRNILNEIKRKEEEILEKYKEKINKKEFLNILKGGQESLFNVYQELYSDVLKKFRKEKIKIWKDYIPQYYRKKSGYLSDYSKKDNLPVFCVIPSPSDKTITIEDEFKKYFNLTIDDFFERVEDGVVFPLIREPSRYSRDDYIEFFRKFEKKFGFYPPYANRLPEILGFSSLKNKWVRRLICEIGYVVGNENRAKEILSEEITYCCSLKPAKPIEYLPERLAFLELIEGDFLCNIITDIAKEDVKDAMNYTFSIHQCFSVWVFYSKGGLNIFAPIDLDRATNVFKNLAERVEREIKVIEKALFILEPIELPIRKIIEKTKIKLPIGKNPEEEKRIYRKHKKSEEIQSTKSEITNLENKIFKYISSKKYDDYYSKIIELDESYKNLCELYVKYFSREVKLTFSSIGFTAETTLHHCLELGYDLKSILLQKFGTFILGKLIEIIAELGKKKDIKNKAINNLIVPIHIWHIDRKTN